MAYFDYANGCPVDERVIEAMMPYMTDEIGNPSSVHSLGLKARKALDDAREKVSMLINGAEGDIIFTSGATEANNLAIIGYGMRYKRKGNHIIASSIEHMSVINSCKFLQKNGFEVTFIPVDRNGIVDVEEIEKSIRPDTILVTVQHANGEIGTIQPVEEIGKIVKEKGVAFHVDASASLGKIEVDVERMGADLVTLSSNDIYGPRGVGGLFIRRGIRVQPIIVGGGQEKGLRSGTENVAGIVGFGKAAEIAKEEYKEEARREEKLRDELIARILEIEETYLNGHPELRLPNNVNVRFSYIEGESLVLSLDMEGIYASTASACTSKTLEPSHVLIACGLKHEEAHGSLLFTLGKGNTEEDIDRLMEVLPKVVERLRMMSPLYRKSKGG
ncbi:MAG: cysteine desulfurase [Archaeoglobus sp.]|nr:cysteine desulfurase [Archaeoglobus sp.]